MICLKKKTMVILLLADTYLQVYCEYQRYGPNNIVNIIM